MNLPQSVWLTFENFRLHAWNHHEISGIIQHNNRINLIAIIIQNIYKTLFLYLLFCYLYLHIFAIHLSEIAGNRDKKKFLFYEEMNYHYVNKIFLADFRITEQSKKAVLQPLFDNVEKWSNIL